MVTHVAETGSTNDDLVAAAQAGAVDRSVIVADFQTAGRGRLDRTWQAARGANLLVSLLFRHTTTDAARFSRIVALAARAACHELCAVTPDLKWPNDLIVDSRKLGGLLAVGSPREGFVVVGIGINVMWAPPEALALCDATPMQKPVALSPLQLLAAMLREIDRRMAVDDDQLFAEHRAALATLGSRVRVDLRVGESIVGVAFDLDSSSRLLVRDDDGQVHVIDVGDVMHLRGQ